MRYTTPAVRAGLIASLAMLALALTSSSAAAQMPPPPPTTLTIMYFNVTPMSNPTEYRCRVKVTSNTGNLDNVTVTVTEWDGKKFTMTLDENAMIDTVINIPVGTRSWMEAVATNGQITSPLKMFTITPR